MGYAYLISYHGINISYIKGMKKRGWIIYLITYPVPCLVEHKIGQVIG